MYRYCPERTSVMEGSGGRVILEPTVEVLTNEVGATLSRDKGRGRTFTIDRGMSISES